MSTFPNLVPITVTVLNGQTTSTPVALTGLALRKSGFLAAVQVECPDVLNSTSAELQFHSTSTPANFKSRYDEYGTLINFATAAGRTVNLNPSLNCAIFPYMVLKMGSAATADRTFTVYFRQV